MQMRKRNQLRGVEVVGPAFLLHRLESIRALRGRQLLPQSSEIARRRIEEAGNQHRLDVVRVSDREAASALYVQRTALDRLDDVSAATEEAVEQCDMRREGKFHVK